jgi:hypothetical protein
MRSHAKVRSRAKALLFLGCLPLVWAGAASAEGVDVKITNDGTQDIVVTVYDMSTSPQRVILTNARINGFTSVPISLIADSTGRANLSWTATSTDPTFPKCGHADTVVSNDGSVNVHADSSCGA